jgi:hypothetical protein
MERTHPDPIDEALHRLIEQPSYGAQVLVCTARMLTMDADEAMTADSLRRAMAIATDTVLGTLPEAVRNIALERALRAVPHDLTGITRGEAALRLRAAAKAIA